MKTLRSLTPNHVRRLAIVRQHLADNRLPPTPEGILQTVQDLNCLQLDPISAVARSHTLVLRSRVGKYDPAHLDQLLWQDRSLFEYWAHAASIVLTEDYPIHNHMMRSFSEGGKGAWDGRVHAFMKENAALRQHILDSMKSGPMLSRQFEDLSERGWESSGWTGGRNVSRVLDFLWFQGEIMVVGRQGGQKMWGLAESHFPDWTPRDLLDDQTLVYRGAQKSLRALGVATVKHIKEHFIRNRYTNLPAVIKALEHDGVIEPVRIEAEGKNWSGTWYIHTADIPLLEQIQAGEWNPRTTLLSPFDNLICDRDRTELMFNFYFRLEIYVPKEKRQYGYYVLPILHGDELIGRIDPQFDRKTGQLQINAVYAEPNAPKNAGKAVAKAINELADFLDAKDIVYGDVQPDMWKKALTSS
jgi:uncharacterized protein YcaQ